jgi:hypothetical protein
MRVLMKTLGLAALAASLLLGAALPAAAQTSPFAVGANIGTPGVGAEIQFQVAPSLVIRGDADWLSFHRNDTWSDVPYRGRLKSTTAGVFADWHPGQSSFVVSGGGYFGKRRIRLRSRNTGDVVVGGLTFTPEQIGQIEGRAKLSDAEPFVGVGWDNTFTGGHAWGFRALAGVSFSSSPKVRLSSVGGTFSNDPVVLAALQREEEDVRHDARHWKYYPVLQLGVTRRF